MTSTRRPSTSCSSRPSRSSPTSARRSARPRRTCAATLAEVTDAAETRGLGVMCSGTHPMTDWATQEISPNPRYAMLVEQMQWMARQLQIFGVHVHVGVRAPEKAIPIVNALTFYVPHFLALSASSPFWMGNDTGLASVPVEGVRAAADRGPALPALRLGPVREADGDAHRVTGRAVGARGLVGHPSAPRLRHRRAADLRRACRPCARSVRSPR